MRKYCVTEFMTSLRQTDLGKNHQTIVLNDTATTTMPINPTFLPLVTDEHR